MMNDFTKEELKFISDLLTYQSSENMNEELRDKVDSMIDNYCEHEPGYYVTPDENILTCHKCKKRLHKSKELRLIE